MKVTPLKIPDVKLIEPEVFEDGRGFFYESFNQQKFNEAIGQNIYFVQDNHSRSVKGVLRGMHYQEEPYSQGKLVRVLSGEVFDVAIDLRKNSATYRQWVSMVLSGENRKQLWIPEGFAHGFLTLSDRAEFFYKVTNFYNKEYEKNFSYDDQIFNIKWPGNKKDFILSSKDLIGNL